MVHKMKLPYKVIIEVLASLIAESIEVPHDRVQLLCPMYLWVFYNFTYKSIGVPLPITNIAHSIDVQQSYRPVDSKRYYEYSLLPKYKRGLSIQSLAYHGDLPVITALDAFLRNYDRT